MSNKILVVDDDPAVRRMLSLLFEGIAGVLLASSGEEALKLVGSERPRLMLVDMTMPGMSGLETLTAAHAAVPAMTIIMLTGKVDVDLAKRALELGAVEYVTKPFDLPRLKDRVKRCMNVVPADDLNRSGAPWRVVPPEENLTEIK